MLLSLSLLLPLLFLLLLLLLLFLLLLLLLLFLLLLLLPLLHAPAAGNARQGQRRLIVRTSASDLSQQQ